MWIGIWISMLRRRWNGEEKERKRKKNFFFFFVAYWVYIMFILGPPSGRPRVVALYVCIQLYWDLGHMYWDFWIA